MTLATRVLCFVVLPCLPGIALAFLPPQPVPIVRDRIVVIVFAGLLAAMLSAALALASGRTRGTALAYALATAALEVVPIVAYIWLLFELACGDGHTEGVC